MQKTVKITKLNHAQDPLTKIQYLQKGEYRIGMMTTEPVVGDRFNLYAISSDYPYRGISTSGVQEILSENTFRTYNSIYQWEVIELEPQNAN